MVIVLEKRRNMQKKTKIIQTVVMLMIGISCIGLLLMQTWKKEEEQEKRTKSMIQKEQQGQRKENKNQEEKGKTKIPEEWQENGIFSNQEEQAYKKLQTLTIDEKIAQLLLVTYPSQNPVQTLEKYQFGGYVFFAKDFENKTEKQVKEMLAKLQKVSKIPIITAVDEEGGKVVRISSNKNLAKSKFLSPKQLYQKRWLGRN